MKNQNETGSPTSHELLLIQVDPTAGDQLRTVFMQNGFQVTSANSGAAGLAMVPQVQPDLVLLDMDNPEEDSWEVCRRLLDKDHLPLILLKSSDEPADCVLGLELGADDYVVKPFHPREIVARAKGILRRWSGRPISRRPGPRQFPGLSLDPQRYDVRVSGRSIHLTPLEFDLLWHLTAMPGQVLSREELLKIIWDGRGNRNLRTVDAYIRRLRQKLQPGIVTSWRIRTIYGQGYRFEAEE